jgi:hypothetical protein
MREDPLSTFLVFMSGHNPDQMHLGDVARWYTLAMYWALLIGSLAIAYWNLREDPSQRTVRHVSIFLMRLLAAGMWYLETLWKLPGSVTSGFRFWLDQTVKFDAYAAHARLLQVLADHIGGVQPLVYCLELAIAASLMLGLFVPLWGTVAALYVVNLFLGLYNDPAEWPWTYAGLFCAHGMFAAARAGQSLGADALILRRSASRSACAGPLARI